MSTQAGAVEQQAESTEQVVVPPETEATETAAADAASAAASESTETQPDKSDEDKGQRGIERRFAKMTARQKELELERDFYKAKALGTGEQPPTKAAEAPKKPNPADFESTEAYLDARDEWVKQETLRAAREELQKTETAREKQSEEEIVAQEWDEREKAFREKSPDFDEVVDEAMNAEGTGILQVTKGPAQGTVGYAVQISENGPALLYYLAQHPEEARSIIAMQPSRAMLAMGRIEARLATDNGGGDQKPPLTRAPKPPTPVRKAVSTTVLDPDKPEDAEKMTPQEYWAAREAKRKQRR